MMRDFRDNYISSALAEFQRSAVSPDLSKHLASYAKLNQRSAISSAQRKVKRASVRLDAPEQIIGAKAGLAAFIARDLSLFTLPPASLNSAVSFCDISKQLVVMWN